MTAQEGMLDVRLAGTVFMDLVFSGLTTTPGLGTEIRTEGLGSSPGGMANLAVALARLDLKVGLVANFATDLYGSYLWRTLGEQEGVDLSASRRVGGWATPLTVSLAYERERSMITYEEPPPASIGELLAAPARRGPGSPEGRRGPGSPEGRRGPGNPEGRRGPGNPEGRRGPGNPEGVPRAVGPRAVGPRAIGSRSFYTHVDDRRMAWLPAIRQAGATVFADVGWDHSERWSRRVLDNLSMIDVFVPNAVEAMAYTRTATPQAALEVLAHLVPVAVVKCGRDGALACSLASGERVSEPAVAVEALDPTGAGDVFGAGLVFGTLEGWPLAERVRFANLCAALSCRFYGGSLSAPCWNEIASWCRALDADPSAPAALKRSYRFLRPYFERHVRLVKCRRPRPTIHAAG